MSGSGDDGGWQTRSGRSGQVTWELGDEAGASPAGGSPRGSSNGVLAVTGAGVIVIIGLVAWFLATSPANNTPSEPVAAEQSATPGTVEPADSSLDLQAAVDFVETRASSSFRQMLTDTAASMGIAYRTSDQVTLLDFGRGEIASMEESVVSQGGAAIELLRTADGRTYAIDATRRQATLVAGGGYVIDTLWPGLVARTASSGPVVGPGEWATVGRLDGSPPQLDVSLPIGARLRAFPGVGLVAVSADGSDLVGPGELSHLSDNEIVSATSTARLERVATRGGSALRVIDDESGQTRATLPDALDEAGSSFLLSPNGSYVLRVGAEGGADLYSLADGGITWVIGEGMQEPHWAPDSSFVVWLDTVADDPQLKIMFLEPRVWIAVGLAEIGAGLPQGPELVIVS